MMNGFEIVGHGIHILGILCILTSIIRNSSCKGISGKTQFLYALVFTTRFLDILEDAPLELVIKATYILSTYTALILFFVFRSTYEYKKDGFWVEALVLPLIILSVFINHNASPEEILSTLSRWLEAVAAVPQLYQVYSGGSAPLVVRWFLVSLACARGFQGLSWLYNASLAPVPISASLADLDVKTVVPPLLQLSILLLYFLIPKLPEPHLPPSKNSLLGGGHWASNILLRQKWFLCNPFKSLKNAAPGLERVAVIGREVPPSSTPPTHHDPDRF